MKLLTKAIEQKLRRNADLTSAALETSDTRPDHVPVVKFFDPMGAGTWLVTELHDGNVAFGLADLGVGCPELGYFSVDELQALKVGCGLGIERDIAWKGVAPLSVYTDAAQEHGRIVDVRPSEPPVARP